MFITRGNLPKFKILLFNVGRRGGGGRGIKGGRGVNMGKGDVASLPHCRRGGLGVEKQREGNSIYVRGRGGGEGRI